MRTLTPLHKTANWVPMVSSIERFHCIHICVNLYITLTYYVYYTHSHLVLLFTHIVIRTYVHMCKWSECVCSSLSLWRTPLPLEAEMQKVKPDLTARRRVTTSLPAVSLGQRSHLFLPSCPFTPDAASSIFHEVMMAGRGGAGRVI